MEYATVYVCDTVTARKAHDCCECHGIIFKGEKYNKHHGIFDCSGFTFKVCSDCDALRADIDKGIKYHDERVPFEGLSEWVFDNGEIDNMRRLLEIKTKRKAPIHKWMVEHFDSVINKKDDELAKKEEFYEQLEQ